MPGRGGEQAAMFAARDLGRRDRHDRAGDVAVAPAGHVAARGIHRDALLPGGEARLHLQLEIGQVAFCASANRFTLAWANSMSRFSLSGTCAQAASIFLASGRCCPRTCRTSGVFQRLLASPPVSMSSRIP
jgi:hypothetical protein